VGKQKGYLKGHTIAYGSGRNRRQAILKLCNYNKKFKFAPANSVIMPNK
jgi:hypothetical protein